MASIKTDGILGVNGVCRLVLVLTASVCGIAPMAVEAETNNICAESNAACLQAQLPSSGDPTGPLPIPTDRPPPGPATITVERFEFEGNTAFSDRELAEVVAGLVGRPLSFVELLEAEKAIERAYAEAGYLNSGAAIEAEQTLSPTNAVVAVSIVEGEVEAIEVTGNRRLRQGYVRSRLEMATQGALNQNKILEALQLLQLDPLIESVSAELSAGSRPQLTVLSVRIEEANPWELSAFVNNGRVPSVGTIRRGVDVRQGNVLGFGDKLTAIYTNTDGSNAGDFAYRLPFNGLNGTFEFTGGISDTEVIEPPFDRIDLTGYSYYWSAGVRQPIVRTPRRELALGMSLTGQDSQTKIFGEGVQLSEGANDNGRIRIRALRFSQDWTQRGNRDVFAMRSQVSAGLDTLGATENDSSPDSRFWVWRGQAQYARSLAPDTLLVVRSDLQLADRPLLVQEQFSLGGVNSVRGYRQDALLTDSGWQISAETALPVLRIPEVEGVLQLIPFADYGVGWNAGNRKDPEDSDLLGMGIGVQWRMGEWFSGRVDWGFPLIDRPDRDRTLQEQGIYFSVELTPF